MLEMWQKNYKGRLLNTLHEQEVGPPNRSKGSRETRQRLGTNNIPTRSLGLNKRRNIDKQTEEM